MTRLHPLPRACKIVRTAWPMYAEAYLRGAALTAPFQAAREHLVACPTCAADFGQLLALYTWREAQEPFNAGSLPLSAMWAPIPTRSIL